MTRTAMINCNGTIHDDDSWDPFGTDEEEEFSWSKGITLENGGFSRAWEESHTVDGEVQLRAHLRLECTPDGVISISGTLELWEGGGHWTLEKSESLDNVLVQPDSTNTVYEGRIADNQGDWAEFKLEVQNRA